MIGIDEHDVSLNVTSSSLDISISPTTSQCVPNGGVSIGGFKTFDTGMIGQP